MGLTLGGNNSSFKNIRYLSESKSKMDKSLLRISSGKRILTAADDSGGLSVAMKLQNQINTTKAAQGRVENSKSFVRRPHATLFQMSWRISCGNTTSLRKTLMISDRDYMQSDPLLGTD